jgi:outer membrane protein assembly factor BamA
VGIDAHWSQGSLALPPTEGGRTDIDIWSGSVSLGLAAARTAYLGLEVTGEWTNGSRGSSDAASVSLLSGAMVLDHETLDRIDFPRRGADVTGRFEWGGTDVTEAGWFSSTILDARYYVPIHPRLVADVGLFAGYARGVDLPLHRRFFLGGAHRSAVFSATQPTFQGLESQGQSGRAVQVGRLGIRAEVGTDWFVRGGVDVGAIRDAWEAPLTVPMTGWALSLGFRSRIGPVVGEVSRVWGDHDPRVSVSVGRSF